MIDKVNFILIGAQKSGTTSLAYYLGQHPQINFSERKEPQFFSKNDNWKNELSSYHQLFDFEQGSIVGEASTTYSWYPQFHKTASRIYAYNPEIKLIYLIRDPVARIESHYMHRLLKAKLNTSLTVEEEILSNPIYINRSRYAMQVNQYLKYFSRQQILLLTFEELKENPHAAFRSVSEFLRVPVQAVDSIDFSVQNKSIERRGETRLKKILTPIARLFPLRIRNLLRDPFMYTVKEPIRLSVELKKKIWEMVYLDVLEIEKIIGRKMTAWREANNYYD